MSQTASQIINDLKSGRYALVYLLQGEEPFEIDQISSFIESNALPEEQKGFNQIIMYGKDSKIPDIISNARRFPMMHDRQVLIVKEAQELGDFGNEAAQKLLLGYLEQPVPSTVLVFCHKRKNLDRRGVVYKAFKKSATILETKKLYDNQVPSWIESYMAGKKVSSTPKAVQMLANNIGTNLERLSHEIDKMLININDGETIDEHVVEKYVGISREYNAFEFQNALVHHDFEKANRIINYFDSNWKNSPIYMLIGILFSFYSKVLIVHQAEDKSQKGLASALRTNPFFVRDYMTAARNYSLPKVIRNIKYIKEADLQIKGISAPRLPEGQIMRELTFKLMYG
jgi:DNA polymerase-3 subunit delta